MTDSQLLLADYAANGSETAFRKLVARYLDLVYSTALRLLEGDSHLAEDAAQTVFADLARQARALPRDTALGGWLHRDTCFVAAKWMRSERRRRIRERRAAEMNSTQDHSEANLARITPVLDDAISRLGAADRAAIVHRFYERMDLRSVACEMGTSEAAAQKRVLRALEKLRAMLRRRGVQCSVAALGAALAGQGVTAAPAGLAATISGAALASPAAGGVFALMKTMVMTKLKLGVIGALVAGLVAPLVIQRAQLLGRNRALERQNGELAGLRAENTILSNSLASAENAKLRSDAELLELMRLRSQVGQLLRDKNEYEAALADAARSNKRPSAPAQGPPVDARRIAREAWAFAGYQTPGDALQSLMWAMKNGDLNTFLSSFTPEARQTVVQGFAGMSDAEIAARIQKESAGLDTLCLDRTKNVTGTETTFILNSQETDNGVVRTRDEAVATFKEINGEWKATGW